MRIITLYFLKKCSIHKSKEVIRAKNGIQAVNIVKNEPNVWVILNGYKNAWDGRLSSNKRNKEIKPSIPVIAQTAYAMAEDIIKGKRTLSTNQYLSKPIKPEVLINTLKRFI